MVTCLVRSVQTPLSEAMMSCFMPVIHSLLTTDDNATLQVSVDYLVYLVEQGCRFSYFSDNSGFSYVGSESIFSLFPSSEWW